MSNDYVITDKRSGLSPCGRYIVGIDIGINGYAALLNIDTFDVQFFPLPTTTYLIHVKNKDLDAPAIRKKRRRIDEKRLRDLINSLVQPIVTCFVVEHQAPFPGQGHVSTGKLLYLYGLIKGLIMQTHIPLEVVKPSKWKKALGLIAPRTKNAPTRLPLTTYAKKCKAWALAIHLFPEQREQLTPKSRSFDKAEALLLAYFGLQFRLEKFGIKEPAA